MLWPYTPYIETRVGSLRGFALGRARSIVVFDGIPPLIHGVVAVGAVALLDRYDHWLLFVPSSSLYVLLIQPSLPALAELISVGVGTRLGRQVG